MDTRLWVATCPLALLFGTIPSVAPGAGAGTSAFVLELRTFSYALNSVDVEATRLMADEVLSSANIEITWRDCGHDDGCSAPRGRYPFILVHLLPILRASDASVSGDAVHGPGETPTVLVYVRRNAQITETMRQSQAARSFPELSTLTTGHLLGLTIAHEVGHILGLIHASSGVMKPKFTVEDVIAARRSSFVFHHDEVERMRRALEAMTAPAPDVKQVVSPGTRSV